MTSIALDVAQKELPDLIEDVILGGHVVITKDHTPVAEIVPTSNHKGTPVYGSAKGMITLSQDFDAPLDDFEKYTK